jgi:hypothetical protein
MIIDAISNRANTMPAIAADRRASPGTGRSLRSCPRSCPVPDRALLPAFHHPEAEAIVAGVGGGDGQG